MVDLDKPHFSDILQHFGTVHKFTVTDAVRRAYWDDLKDMDRASFVRAVAELRKSAQWMPKPREFWLASRKGWM